MEIDLYKFLSAAALKTESDEIDTIGRREIDQIEKNLNNLQVELDEIARRLKIESLRSARQYFYFDFDVVFSSINWLTSLRRLKYFRSFDSLWSSLCVNFYAGESYLLPGSLFEICRFVEKLNPNSFSRNSGALASAFEAQFLKHTAANAEIPSFFSAVKALKRIEFDVSLYYVLHKLLSNMPSHDGSQANFEFDVDTFQYAYYALKTGKRREQYLNNRVDALNFAIAAHRNKIERQGHHSIISVSPAMHRLLPIHIAMDNVSSPSDEFDNSVISPRQACLYHLLRGSNDDPGVAEQITRNWLKDLHRLRYRLAELRSKVGERGFLRRDQLEEDVELVNVVWMFEGLQKEISRIKHQQLKELHAFSKVYKQKDQYDFLMEIEKQVKSQMKKSKYKDLIYGKNAHQKDVEVSEFDEDVKSGLGRAFEIYSKEMAVNVAGGNSNFRIWTRLDIDHNVFAEKVGRLAGLLVDKFLSNQYIIENLPLSDELENDPTKLFSKGTWFINTREMPHSFPAAMTDPIDLHASMKQSGDEAPIVFSRYVCRLFSTSYDGVMLGLKTRVDIAEDLRDFVDELVDNDFVALRTDEARSAIDSCVRNAGLIQLDRRIEV